MRYLIDGYNLAHWLLRDDELLPEQLRTRLLAVLKPQVPKNATQVDIYWDVRKPNPSIPQRESLGWCTAHNVPSADEAIIDAVYDAAEPRALTVVSRDREVTGKSRQLGAKILAPDQFLKR